ncbi:hypothetical protein HanRHA438_Chr16g0752011 [Helianthus annuus]|nr:hypothetical protein HanIR_Chr16g0804411 [Helianthus annuus]KAJ0820567.1 hypothetical protein HanPSC8_Chr16g0709491 [Helianthus annuus]KAJ0835166.1 hypothetical protein HanRHA438_Chr16g0752011 [Helianthus annuus]
MFNFIPCFLCFSTLFQISFSEQQPQPTTIYELLRSNGLPMGLLPKGVTNFTFDNSGRFEVHLDQACNAKFEDELHYDLNISGNLTYGQIGGLSGISAQDLFLWFPVKEIRVDIPSSGLIYFDVGVVSKQFSLSSFETPRECLANSNRVVIQSVFKVLVYGLWNLSRKFGTRKNDDQEHLTTFL